MDRFTVIYDGECRACGRFVALLGRWDRRGRFETVPYQHPTVPARFPSIPAADLKAALQLVAPEGRRWAGAAAIDRILGELPGGWLFGWAFRVPLLGGLLDRFYRWFARNRSSFGCGAHCP